MTPNFLLYFIFSTILFYIDSYASRAFCLDTVNSQRNSPQNLPKCKRVLEKTIPPKVIPKKDPLDLIKELFKLIKEDTNNHSYDQMLEDVKAEHSIKYHKPNAPFFYSNDAFVMKDIIDLLLEDPDGFIDETKTKGVLKVYRNNDFHNEIEELFDREPYYRRDIPQPKKFQKDYLGLTANGPTNQVMVTLKLKGDEQNAETLEKRLAYIGNNIVFVDAFPVKNPPPPSKAKASRPLTENKSFISKGKPDNTSSEDLKTGESKPTDSQSDESTPEESKVTDTKAESLKEDKAPVDSKQDKPMTEDSKTTDAKSKNIQSEKSKSEDSNPEKGQPESKESKSDITTPTEPTK